MPLIVAPLSPRRLLVEPSQASLVAKDALRRRRRDGLDAGFVDDGFALGLAFAMEVGD